MPFKHYDWFEQRLQSFTLLTSCYVFCATLVSSASFKIVSMTGIVPINCTVILLRINTTSSAKVVNFSNLQIYFRWPKSGFIVVLSFHQYLQIHKIERGTVNSNGWMSGILHVNFVQFHVNTFRNAEIPLIE